jgi:signal transduction histidine kinase
LEVDTGGELLEALSQKNYTQNKPANFYRLNGQSLPGEYSTDALSGSGGLRHSLVFRDISQRLEMEAHRQQAASVAERKRLAEDVHDGIMSYINVTVMQIRSARSNLLAEELEMAYAQLLTAESHARTGLTEARRFNHLYQEQTWPWLNFIQRLQQVVDMAQAGGIAQADLELRGETQLAYTQGQDLLRIVEQAVHKSLEHGQPQSLTVKVVVEPTQLVVAVLDDGRGFVPGTVQEGFGLTSMYKRAERIGAALKITSQPEGGTTIEVTIPLEKEQS